MSLLRQAGNPAHRAARVLCLVLLAGGATAQQPAAEAAGDQREALRQRDDDFQQALHRLVLHHLGIEVVAVSQPAADAPRATPLELERALEAERAAVEAAAATLAERQEAITRLRAGIPLVEPVGDSAAAPPGGAPVLVSGSEAARPEPEPVLVGAVDAPALRGEALFRADRHDDALPLLQRAVAVPQPRLADLFLLACCHERLGDLARAEELFQRVEAIDTRRQADGTRVAGPWAQSARMAAKHMAWMRAHRGWSIALPVRAPQRRPQPPEAPRGGAAAQGRG